MDDISKKEELLKWTESEKGNFSTFNSGASKNYKEAVNSLGSTLTNIIPLEKKIKKFIKIIQEEGTKLGRDMSALNNTKEFLKEKEDEIDDKIRVANKFDTLCATIKSAAENEKSCMNIMTETRKIKGEIAGIDISGLINVDDALPQKNQNLLS